MVAGKNTPQALARAAPTPKLPPLPKLRVRKPTQGDANPCLGMMTSVLGACVAITSTRDGQMDLPESCTVARLFGDDILTVCICAGCWASQGYTTKGCAVLETQLRACMDARVRSLRGA